MEQQLVEKVRCS